MRKITDFIVNKRYIILFIFIVFTVMSVIWMGKVKVNSDMTKYLPSTSETRIGMDIMEDEFSDVDDASTLKIMFKGLSKEEKKQIDKELSDIEGVSSVDYDDTEDYNKDDYTLYVINVDEPEDSETATNVYNTVTEKYKDYETYKSGGITANNTAVLPTWILVVAISLSIVILVFMSESYVEPFCFLLTIFIAVLLNNGTNIIFDSVSSVTNAIAAILQMALSMDYSIMLMSRYRQERQNEQDKVKAMKNALYYGFKSISSSSVTTIVGLSALVFMSYKIGKDLGLVLAKGVLLSLVTIFFVLPTIILMCDKLIEKTKKRSLNIKLDKLGKFSYKLRFPMVFIFLTIFVSCYMLKGNLTILYTASELDEISKVFGQNNSVVVVYKNSEEQEISKKLQEIEQKENVKSVVAYGNTINEKLSYDKLSEELKDMDSDIEIDDYLLKILYYKYYNSKENNKMTFTEMYDFIQKEVKNNKDIDILKDDSKENIDRLKYFTKADEINKKRNASEISKVLEIKKENINDIFVYYNSKNNNLKLTMNDFVKFINNDVLTDSKYSGNIDQKTKSSIKQLTNFTNKNTINKKMTSSQIANLFGMSKTSINDLYTYYISKSNITTKMTISQFTNFVQNTVMKDKKYNKSFDKDTVNNIKMLSTFCDTNVINKKMNSKKLSEMLGIDENSVNQIMYMKYAKTGNMDMTTWTMTPKEFVNIIIQNKETLKNGMKPEIMDKIGLLANIMQSAENKTKYTYKELSKFIGIKEDSVKNIYVLYVTKNTTTKLTPMEFVNFVLNNKDDKLLAKNLNKDTINSLKLLQKVMKNTISNTKYNSKSLSSTLGMDKESVDLLYGLYVSKNVNKDQTMTLKNLVNFILEDVMKNSSYSDSFDKNAKKELETVNTIMNASLKETKYTNTEMYKILGNLTDELDKNTIDLLYIYYGSEKEYNKNWNLTIEQFVEFLNNDILKDDRFNEFISKDMKKSIIDSKDTIKDLKDMVMGDEYSRVVINTNLDLESDKTFEFMEDVKNMLGKDEAEVYVVGDSALAHEMSKTFEDEFNFISIITMIAIFIVVAITFRSLIIPLILVLTIQCAVYTTMGILSLAGGSVYFIAILIVQSILMGATIDYAILYTSYYLEHRRKMDMKEAIINAYNKSIHTILVSASIIIIVTFTIGSFATEITAKICKTIAEGTLCSSILILLVLPGVLAAFDKIIIKKKDRV